MVLASPSSDGGEVSPDGTKKKKLTNHLEKSDGRRLVEYLVVVSSIPREATNDGEEKMKDPTAEDEQYRLFTNIDDENVELVDHEGFKPEITARYPQYDHEDNPFDANVSYFCHISGAIELKIKPFMPKVRNSTDRDAMRFDRDNNTGSLILSFFSVLSHVYTFHILIESIRYSIITCSVWYC